jgi:hypothetical protein
MGATKSLLSSHRYIPDTSMDTGISIEGPTDEASISAEPNKSMSGTTSTLKRKVCTKTCVTKLTAANILLSSPDEYIPARKKPRFQCWIPVGFNFEACQIPDKAALPAIAADADSLNAYVCVAGRCWCSCSCCICRWLQEAQTLLPLVL